MDRALAEQRMARAKSEFTKAAVAVLRGYPLAEVMAAQALEELVAARAELRNLNA
jgi:hypothetical protein